MNLSFATVKVLDRRRREVLKHSAGGMDEIDYGRIHVDGKVQGLYTAGSKQIPGIHSRGQTSSTSYSLQGANRYLVCHFREQIGTWHVTPSSKQVLGMTP
jgi:hypothetical protein